MRNKDIGVRSYQNIEVYEVKIGGADIKMGARRKQIESFLKNSN